MATYKCQRCGNVVVLSIKPGKCEVCGASQFKALSSQKPEDTSPSGMNSGMSGTSVSSKSSNAPAPKKPAKSSISTPSTPKSPAPTPKTPPKSQDSQREKTQSSSLLNPPPSRKKNSAQPSLPAYSLSGKNPPSQVTKSQQDLPSSRGLKPSSRREKLAGKVPPPKKKLEIPWKWIFGLLILILGGVGYWQWQSQFDTSEFQKIVLKENFSSPNNWTLTDGSKFKNGGLFQSQSEPNSMGLSIWHGRKFNDLDYSAEAVKAGGPENLPFGIVARINGAQSQNFYYLLIDGKGEYSLGKKVQNKWFEKVGWKMSKIVNKGNRKNILRLVCKGDLIMGFINGKKVGSFRDNGYQIGKIGIFSRRGTGKPVEVYFDNIVVKIPIKDPSAGIDKRLSPQKAIREYYSKNNTTAENKNFWDLVKQVNIYSFKNLKNNGQEAKVQVWLKYDMKNGITICESRVVNLTFDFQTDKWIVKNSESVVQKPDCDI